MKSDHLYTFLSPDRQDFDIRSVSAGDSTWSHTLTFVSIPMKLWLTSKPPPKVSCSRANVSDPPDFITWPLFNAFPCAATAPSLYNFYEPLIFSQDEQTWCHFLSFVETEDGSRRQTCVVNILVLHAPPPSYSCFINSFTFSWPILKHESVFIHYRICYCSISIKLSLLWDPASHVTNLILMSCKIYCFLSLAPGGMRTAYNIWPYGNVPLKMVNRVYIFARGFPKYGFKFRASLF